MTERHHNNYCYHTKELMIIGTGGLDNVGRKNKFYNAYYCPLCKKVYFEDFFNNHKIRLFYSKKVTLEHLKYIKKILKRYCK